MESWTTTDPPSLPRPSLPGRVRLHDSATGRMVESGPEAGRARMYVCGITPYDATHLGHANTYVAFDLLHRIWRDLGLDVNYVQNITDVDDPLLERAAATGVDWTKLAAEQTQLFRDDMQALNVLPPRHYVAATESIGLVVELIQLLERRGAIYAIDDREHPDLYFDRSTDPHFGNVARLDLDQALTLSAERGGDPDRPGKRDPLDCLVWLQQRAGEPGWPSPWGPGRPGWHIECTAIALQLLGVDFDVQAGGSDLIFPHHEMCAAEGRAATAEPFAQTYVHSGMVGLDGEKMSKSRGNLVLVSELRAQGVDPMVIRLALLSQHYRKNWEWDDSLLDAATGRLALWREAVRLDAGLNADSVLAAMRQALCADLDAPAALAAVDGWAGASTAIDGDDSAAPSMLAQACDALLGVKL